MRKFLLAHFRATHRHLGKVNMKPLSHVAFDLDGVLIDSLLVMKKSWITACGELGLEISFDDGYRKLIGRPFPQILEELSVPDHLHEVLGARYFQLSKEEEGLVCVYPGVAKAVSELKQMGVALSIVTSKPLERARSLVESLLPDMDCVLVSPELLKTGRGKPAPDGLILAASLHDVSPKQSLFVGDMDVDFLAAKSAGFRYLHAAWGYGDADEETPIAASIFSVVDRVREANLNAE